MSRRLNQFATRFASELSVRFDDVMERKLAGVAERLEGRRPGVGVPHGLTVPVLIALFGAARLAWASTAPASGAAVPAQDALAAAR
jgi:hypothetical protein